MAKSFGTLNIAGHVGRAYHKPGGNGKKSFAKLSVAVFNRSAKPSEPDDNKTVWVTVTVFGDAADALIDANINKGDFIAASGPLGVERWINKDDEEVKDVALTALSISFVKRGESEQGQAPREDRSHGRVEEIDDEIPFS